MSNNGLFTILKFLDVNRDNGLLTVVCCVVIKVFLSNFQVKSRSIISEFFAKMSIIIGIILEIYEHCQ